MRKKAVTGSGSVCVRRLAFAAMAIVALLLVPGCGSDSDSAGARPQTGSLATVKVAAFPLTQLMLPYVARDEGDFKRQKVNVDIQALSGSAVQEVPRVLNGKLDIGISALADIMPAIAGGAPLVILPGFGTKIEPNLSTATNVIVAKDDEIKSIKDLEGKRVALNALGGAHQLYIKLEMERAGLDAESVKFVQIPLPNIPAAIEKGQVDAGQALDPVLTLAHSMGQHDVLAIGGKVAGDLPSAVYWTSKRWAHEHPREIAAFTAAMASAATTLERGPELMRGYARKYTEFDSKIITRMKNFGLFTPDITPSGIERVTRLLADNGLIKRRPKSSDYIYTAAAD